MAVPLKIRFLPVYALVFLIFIAAIINLFNKSGMPFSLTAVNGVLIASNSEQGILPNGSLIAGIDNKHFTGFEQLELYLDSKNIANELCINYTYAGSNYSQKMHLTAYYSFFEIASQIVSCLLFFLLGTFVIIKGPEGRATVLYHWACFLTGIVIITTPANYSSSFLYSGYALRFIFHFSYAFIPVLFLHFAFIFPIERKPEIDIFLKSAYCIAGLFGLLLNYFFLHSVISFNETRADLFIDFYNIFRLYIIVTLLASIITFIYSFITCNNVSNKKKLKWILYGFIAGPGSYLVFWVLSLLLFSKGMLPEAVINILLAAVPLTTAIAIVKYHFLDIDLIINKSIVYIIVITFFISIYIVLLSTISFIINLEQKIIVVVSGTIIGLLFQPAKSRIQIIVDKKFFRIQYNFRTALSIILNQIKLSNTIEELSEKVIDCFENIIPVNPLLFISLDNADSKIKVINRNYFNGKMFIVEKFIKQIAGDNFDKPYALKEKTEPNIHTNLLPKSFYKETDLCLIVPILSDKNKVIGVIALGEKKSGKPYSLEDVELILQVAADCSFILQRIYLQNELIRKTLEAQNLEELYKLKSFFVAAVSHDLKSPLTAIKMYTDFLKDDPSYSDKKKEYVTVIEEETNNLIFLIDNVLDYSRIESGVKGYVKKDTCLNKLLSNTINAVNYQITINGFTITTKNFEEQVYISADRDAISEAIRNLISNAIKFSIEKKEIEISASLNDGFACISVKDFGIGICNKDMDNLFTPFFRAAEAIANNIPGTGLGLSVVKHIVDAHDGIISISSIKNSGTTVTIKLPVIRKETLIGSLNS